jgi:hypothetical protein
VYVFPQRPTGMTGVGGLARYDHDTSDAMPLAQRSRSTTYVHVLLLIGYYVLVALLEVVPTYYQEAAMSFDRERSDVTWKHFD